MFEIYYVHVYNKEAVLIRINCVLLDAYVVNSN